MPLDHCMLWPSSYHSSEVNFKQEDTVEVCCVWGVFVWLVWDCVSLVFFVVGWLVCLVLLFS